MSCKMDIKKKAQLLEELYFASPLNRFESKIVEYSKVIDAFEETDGATVVISVKITEEICNYMGNTHGAAIACMIDIFSGFACNLTDPTPRITVSLELNANFLAASTIGDELIVKATCHKVGKHLAFTDVKIYCKDKLIAQGRDTKYITNTKLHLPQPKL